MVVGEAAFDRGAEFGGVGDGLHAERGAAGRGLHPPGLGEALDFGDDGVRLGGPAGGAEGDVVDLRDAGGFGAVFAGDFVEAEGAREDPGADVRHVEEFEEALDGAVFAAGAVEDWEDAVDAEEAGAGREAQGLAGDEPAAVAGEVDDDDLVAEGREPLGNGGGTAERDVVFGRAPAPRTATFMAWWLRGLWGWRRRAGRRRW